MPIFVHKVPGKNFMLAFEASTAQEAWAGNKAISDTMKMSGLQPFHQICGNWGNARNENPVTALGFHGWEAWVEVTESWMHELAEIANQRAADNMELW